jgi:hypothetical protein
VLSYMSLIRIYAHFLFFHKFFKFFGLSFPLVVVNDVVFRMFVFVENICSVFY